MLRAIAEKLEATVTGVRARAEQLLAQQAQQAKQAQQAGHAAQGAGGADVAPASQPAKSVLSMT